jgi:putative ABC transport system permease protein
VVSVLGTRTIRRRLTRFTFTAIGVALGIGVLFAVLITNATIDAGLERMLGRTDTPFVQIQPAGGYEAELPVAVIDAAAKLPGVADVSGGTGVYLRIPGAPREREGVFLNGGFERDGPAPTPTLAPKGSDIILEGRQPAEGRDEIILSQAVADQLHTRIGATVEFVGPKGPLRFTVVGLNVRRDHQRDDSRFASTSFATAVRLADRGDTVNYGTIRLAKRTDVGEWMTAHENGLGPNVTLTSGLVDAKSLRDLLSTGKAALAGLAAVALFVSGFLIFLTLSLSVAESTAVHGTMRAIGASRRQVRAAVLTDAVALVLLATPVGLLLGLAGAALTIKLTRSAYGLPNLATVVPLAGVLLSVAVGVVVTIVAALLPAQRAASVAPVVAIRSTVEERRGVGRTWPLGVLSIAAGLAVVLLADQARVDAGSFLVLLGAVLVVPVTIGPITDVAGRLTARMARGVGAVGVMHLRREPRRSSSTLALVMVVLAMVFAAGAVHLSLRRNVARSVSAVFPADLGVFAGARLDRALQDQVRTAPGVREATPLWFTRTTEERPIHSAVDLVIVDPDTFFDVQPLLWSKGSDAAASRALRRGGAVLVPAGVARAQEIHVGDVITLRPAAGPRPFRVAGLYQTPRQPGAFMIGVADGRSVFNVGDPNLLAVDVDAGTSPPAVKSAIEQRFAGNAAVFIRLTSDERADFLRGQTTFFNIVYALVLIALIMGTLGVTNTLAMAMLRRSRELGILRAVGTERRLLRRMAVVESATIGLAGLLLALPLGMLLSYTVLQTVARTNQAVVDYVYPWPMFAVVAPLAVLLAVVSAIAPSRHVGRINPARVLRFD